MVRSHARRSGISSVDDLESESVSTGSQYITRDSAITINVPTDANSLKTASRAASRYVGQGDSGGVVINIESGHTVTTDSRFADGSYQNITITSEDASVTVDGSDFNPTPMIEVERADGPLIDVLFETNGNVDNGIVCIAGTISVSEGSGVKDATNYCARIARSRANLYNTIFTGSGNECLRVTTGSQVFAQAADLSGGSFRDLYVSRSSTLAAEGINAPGVVRSKRSHINIHLSTIGTLEMREGGFVSAHGVDIEKASLVDGSTATLAFSTFNNATEDTVRLKNGSSINIQDSTIEQSGRYGVLSETGSRVCANNVQFNNIPSEAIAATPSGNIITTSDATRDGSDLDAGDTNFGALNTVESLGICFN